MMKLIASAMSGALAVGGAGYSYVTKVQSESAAVHAENVTLKTDNDTKATKIAGMNLAIDDAIRELQTVREKEGAQK